MQITTTITRKTIKEKKLKIVRRNKDKN